VFLEPTKEARIVFSLLGINSFGIGLQIKGIGIISSPSRFPPAEKTKVSFGNYTKGPSSN
jgi:hypothetical protein